MRDVECCSGAVGLLIICGAVNDLNPSPNTTRLIKSGRLTCAVHVSLFGRGPYRFWWGNMM